MLLAILTSAMVVALLFVTRVVASECNLTLTTASGRYAPHGRLCANQLIFEEQFDYFNMDLWEHEETLDGGGNGEFQWYTNSRRNTYVENGALVIKPTLTTDVLPNLFSCSIHLPNCIRGCQHVCSANHPAPPVQSGRVKTTQGFAFKYGRVSVNAKLPTGDWLWPAIWFMPKHSVYGDWPRSGEIDLMEARGNRNVHARGRHIGVEQFGATLHFGTEWYNSAWWSSHFLRNTPAGRGLNQGYHLYQMEWTPTQISFSLDNQLIGTVPTGNGYYRRGQFTGYNPWAKGGPDAPFDQEFYFVLNLAIGGSYGFFPNAGNVGGKPFNNHSPYPIRDFWNGRQQWIPGWNIAQNISLDSALRIDYIRVYAL